MPVRLERCADAGRVRPIALSELVAEVELLGVDVLAQLLVATPAWAGCGWVEELIGRANPLTLSSLSLSHTLTHTHSLLPSPPPKPHLSHTINVLHTCNYPCNLFPKPHLSTRTLLHQDFRPVSTSCRSWIRFWCSSTVAFCTVAVAGRQYLWGDEGDIGAIFKGCGKSPMGQERGLPRCLLLTN